MHAATIADHAIGVPEMPDVLMIFCHTMKVVRSQSLYVTLSHQHVVREVCNRYLEFTRKQSH